MDDVNRAYELLGVTPTMSLEEIEAVYEELLEQYGHLENDNMYYKEKITQWTEAFDCIIDHRIEIAEQMNATSNTQPKRFFSILTLVKLVFIIIVVCVVIKEISWLESPQIITTEPSVYELSNNFNLKLSKFNELDNWDWGYYEDHGKWTVILAIEVLEATEEGAVINTYNFRLGEDYPTTYISNDIYLDEELNQVHYLGENSEIIPVNEKFGIVFNVDAFRPGEERILYYYHPDGSKQEVGRLIFEELEETEDHGIFI
ncbi:MAG: hypothetical protein II005_00945 [Turicibacter sp.]|nr:hypothetical protein [Turicibacter sp.]MEE1238116.1 hypothetical protein [Turicibacter sp.]